MANYMLVDSDQLDADLKTVADSIRAKTGNSEKLSFPVGMKDAIDGIALNTGTTVQIKSGTYTTNTQGSATVDCGFKPDAVLLSASGGQYSNDSGVGFTGFNKTSGSVMLVGSSTNYAYSNHNITQNSTGFSVSAQKYSTSFQASTESNRTVNYVAVKYT